MSNDLDNGTEAVKDRSPPPSRAVVERIAAEEGTDPTELPPLYGSIDPDALDDFFSRGRATDAQSSGRVRFRYAGYDVAVRGDGDVTLDPQ